MFSFAEGRLKPALQKQAKRRYSIRSADRSATGYRPDRSAAETIAPEGGKTRSAEALPGVRVRCRARGPSSRQDHADGDHQRKARGLQESDGSPHSRVVAHRTPEPTRPHRPADSALLPLRNRPASQLPTMMPAALVAREADAVSDRAEAVMLLQDKRRRGDVGDTPIPKACVST